MMYPNFLHNGKEWFIDQQKNILLLVGVLMVGTLAFESGLLRGRISQSAPLVISIPAVTPSQTINDAVSAGAQPLPVETKLVASPVSGIPSASNCPLVGSRNSNKYHLATCAVVKRIKPENKVCFSSKEDAEKRGYVAGCIK